MFHALQMRLRWIIILPKPSLGPNPLVWFAGSGATFLGSASHHASIFLLLTLLPDRRVVFRFFSFFLPLPHAVCPLFPQGTVVKNLYSYIPTTYPPQLLLATTSHPPSFFVFPPGGSTAPPRRAPSSASKGLPSWLVERGRSDWSMVPLEEPSSSHIGTRPLVLVWDVAGI